MDRLQKFIKATELRQCSELVHRDNARMILIYKVIIVASMLIYMIKGTLFQGKQVFVISAICAAISMAEWLVVVLFSKKEKVVRVIIYMSYAQLIVFSGLFAFANEATYMDAGYYIIFAIAPLMFLIQPLHIWIFQTLALAVFCVSAVLCKPADIALFDIVNALGTYVLSLFLGFTIMSRRLASFSIISRERKLYDNAMAKNELNRPGILISHKINLSKNLVEEGYAKDDELLDFLQYSTADEFFDAVIGRVQQKDEHEKAKILLNRNYLLGLFEEGTTQTVMSYERNYGNKLCYGEMELYLVKTMDTGDVLLFLFLRDVTERCMQNRIMLDVSHKNYEMISTMTLSNQLMTLVYGQRKVDEKPAHYGEIISYHWILDDFVDTYVDIGEQAKAREALEVTRVAEMLNREGTYSYILPVCFDQRNEILRKRIDFSYLSKDKGVVLITRSDVTDVYAEEVQRNEELQVALQEAERAVKNRKEFLSQMSHEIRTPMNGIVGTLDILSQYEELKDDKYLRDANISAKYMSCLVNDILDLSKIDNGKYELHEGWIHYQSFISDIMAIICPLAKAKHIVLDSNVKIEKNVSIFVDHNRLQQIFVNILSNAVKFTQKGGHVEYYETFDVIGKDRIKIHAHVVDNGCGMSEEFLAHAFEPFEQEKRHAGQNGTGLGLSIVEKLVEVMDGVLEIDSEVGKGTHLTVTYECAFCDTYKSDVGKMKAKKDEDVDLKDRRCLLVEDNEINREIGKTQFELMGMKVETAVDGQDALDKFEASVEEYYDLIFMDIRMPVMDGLTASSRLRQLSRSDAKSVPIIALSANAFADDVEEALKHGINYYLAKPLEIAQLMKVIRKIDKGE